MIIKVSATPNGPKAELDDADNFTAFSISRGLDVSTADLEQAIARIGRPSGDSHVYVTVDAVAELAGDRARSSEWRSAFEGMCAYAASKGWVDEFGGIRAHID